MKKKNQAHLTRKRRLQIVMLGHGRFGSALSQCFTDSGHQVEILEKDSRPEDWKRLLAEPRLVVLATPFQSLEGLLRRLKSYPKPIGLLSVSKGIDRKTLKTFSEMARPHFRCPIASLSGPSFAQELAEKQPTVSVIASRKMDFAEDLCFQLSTSYFRLYAHDDPVGIEACGAIKNIFAIAAGMLESLGFGHNARAALLSRGMIEMMRVVKALGGKEASVLSVAGIGDLWLTASGDLSRNRRFGQLKAQGLSLETATERIGEVVEGLYTLKQVEKLRKQKKLDLPICEQIYLACFRQKPAGEAIQKLMTRTIKSEESSSWKLR